MENYVSAEIEVCAINDVELVSTSIAYDSNETEEDPVFFDV